MEFKNVPDELLYKYMPIVDEAIISELENRVDYSYHFSEKFDRKMGKLIIKEKYMDNLGWLYKIGSRLAVFSALIIASLFTLIVSIHVF